MYTEHTGFTGLTSLSTLLRTQHIRFLHSATNFDQRTLLPKVLTHYTLYKQCYTNHNLYHRLTLTAFTYRLAHSNSLMLEELQCCSVAAGGQQRMYTTTIQIFQAQHALCCSATH